ncbi:hypothetical protein D3C78_1943280 [compost metagenome]
MDTGDSKTGDVLPPGRATARPVTPTADGKAADVERRQLSRSGTGSDCGDDPFP